MKNFKGLNTDFCTVKITKKNTFSVWGYNKFSFMCRTVGVATECCCT